MDLWPAVLCCAVLHSTAQHSITAIARPVAITGWGPVRVGARSVLEPIWAHIWAHRGPYGPVYGPIWAHIWALMGPPGQVLEDAVNFP